MGLTDSLQHLWNFEEASGNAVDSVGAYTLSAANSPLYQQSGVDGYAAGFTGSNFFSHSSFSHPTGDFSYAAWVQLTTVDRFQAITQHQKTYPRRFLAISVDNELAWHRDGASYRALGSTVLEVDTWYHVGVTRASGGTVKLYVNGEEETLSQGGTDTGPFDGAAGNFYVANGYSSVDELLGYVDQLAIWDRVLSSDEFSDLYASGDGLPYSDWAARATLSGSSSIVAMSSQKHAAATTLQASAAIDARLAVRADASLAGVAGVSADPVCTLAAGGSLAGSATVLAEGSIVVHAAAEVGAAATLDGDAVRRARASADLQASADVLGTPTCQYGFAATLEGDASCQPKLSFWADATFEALAAVDARLEQVAASQLAASASIQATAIRVYMQAANLTAAGTVDAGGIRVKAGIGSVTASASVSATAEVHKYAGTALQAGAIVEFRPSVTRQVTVNHQPPYFDYTDTDLLELTVGEAAVTLSGTPTQLCRYQLDRLDLSYDAGKTLTFSEISTLSYGDASWSLDDSVTLDLDLDGSGKKTYFTGKIRQRTHRGENHSEGVTYTVYGVPQLANEVELETDLAPDVYVGPTITVYSAVGYGIDYDRVVVTYPTVREAVANLFSTMSTKLGSYGVPVAYDLEGLDADSTVWGNCSLRGGFFSALSDLAARDPGTKVWFDDTDQTWKFVKPLDEVRLDLSVNSISLGSHQYDYRLDQSFSAVRLYAIAESSRRTVTVINTLVPLWDSGLERSWCYPYAGSEKSMSLTGLTGGDNPYWPVYRKWALGQSLFGMEKPAEYQLFYPAGAGMRDQWVAAEAELVWPDGQYTPGQAGRSAYVTDATTTVPYAEVVAKQPLVRFGNPYDPGDARGVTTQAKLVLTSVSSGALVAQYRYPETGYAGEAYDLFGVGRTKVLRVQVGEVTERNAHNIWRTVQGAVVSGSFPIVGDPIRECLNLSRGVRLSHGSRTTGIQSITVPLMGYSYKFGPVGESVLSLSNDAAAIIKYTA